MNKILSFSVICSMIFTFSWVVLIIVWQFPSDFSLVLNIISYFLLGMTYMWMMTTSGIIWRKAGESKHKGLLKVNAIFLLFGGLGIVTLFLYFYTVFKINPYL